MIAAILVVVASTVVWWWRRAPEGFLVELRAVDGGALVFWRYNPNRGDSREWVARFDTAGKLDWRRELPGLTSSRASLVIGDVVSVRYTRESEHGVEQAVVAYGLGDGHLMWNTVLTSDAKSRSDLDVLTPFLQVFSAGGNLIEQVIERGEPLTHVLYTLQPSSGQILGHTPINTDMEPRDPLILGDRLILHDIGAHVNVVDTSHGAAVTALHTSDVGVATGCVVGDDYITVADEGDLALVAFHQGDPASRRVLAKPFYAKNGVFIVRSCGRHADRLVFVIVEDLLRGHDSKTSIVLTDLNGTVLASIAMPFSTPWASETSMRSPDVRAFSGSLPRFVPYLNGDDTKEHDLHLYLAMVDLEQARIAWVASKPLELSDAIFHVGDRWYLNNSVTGGDLVEFDGATGQLIAAIHGGKALEPEHVAGGMLWLHRHSWGRLDRAELAAVDPKTLVPLFARGIEITDITKQARDRLGVP